MNVRQTTLPGVLLIEPRVFRDERGFFLESFNGDRFAQHGLPAVFRQDNHSRSAKGVLRGLHYQLRHPQGKLVSVTRGRVFDVAVDIRRGSPTFGKWFGTVLSGDDFKFMWIPPGFAHGFFSLSDDADLIYKCTEVYAPDDDRGILWCDPAIGIEWPVEGPPILSAKDERLMPLAATRTDLPDYLP